MRENRGLKGVKSPAFPGVASILLGSRKKSPLETGTPVFYRFFKLHHFGIDKNAVFLKKLGPLRLYA